MIKTWESRTKESKSGTVDMEIDEELKTLSADRYHIKSMFNLAAITPLEIRILKRLLTW